MRYKRLAFGLVPMLLLTGVGTGSAQLKDVVQVPNAANSGIRKSLADQIGAGRGDINTANSSIYLIKRDPFRAIRRGRQLFQRKFLVSQGLGPVTNDGTGFIEDEGTLGAGLADSCASCHGRPRGSAGFGGDVFTRPDSRDAPHLFGLGLQEMLGDEITRDLRNIKQAAIEGARTNGASVALSLVSKGISYGRIEAHADGSVDTSGVEGVDANLRVKPFFAQGGTISIREFSVGAFNAEMGLESPDPDLATASSGGVVTTPSGMVLDGRLDSIERPPVFSVTEDKDLDGKVNELPTAIVDLMEFYLLNYFKPATYKQTTESVLGRVVFNQVGCASCHKANLRIDSDRRVADVETTYDASQTGFNRLFATATPLFTPFDDGSGLPAIKKPQGSSFLVRNFFADLKRHDLGPNFHEVLFTNQLEKQLMTEPLWGVATTAPYGHDGRSINLEEVILRHGGEAQVSRDRFAALPGFAQNWVLDFLATLVIFPPDDTASNLNPGDPTTPQFPQRGHGSIALGPLFNDPTEVE